MNQAEKNLVDFIVNTYPKRGILFATSWTTYSICSTPEEDLLCAVFPGEERDWIKELPDLIVRLGHEHCADQDEYDGLELFAMFLGDAMRDLAFCHMRDM